MIEAGFQSSAQLFQGVCFLGFPMAKAVVAPLMTYDPVAPNHRFPDAQPAAMDVQALDAISAVDLEVMHVLGRMPRVFQRVFPMRCLLRCRETSRIAISAGWRPISFCDGTMLWLQAQRCKAGRCRGQGSR